MKAVAIIMKNVETMALFLRSSVIVPILCICKTDGFRKNKSDETIGIGREYKHASAE